MKTLLRLTLFLALAVVSFANPIVTINFTGLPGQTAGGYYVGYSTANITTATNQTLVDFSMICDDFLHTTNIPSGPFQYNVSTLADLTGVRFTQSPQLTNYRLAAILLYNFDGLDPITQSSQAGDYNFALWNLFTPSTPDFGNSLSLITDANTQLALGLTNPDNAAAFRDFRIFTPTSANSSQQEFLGISTDNFGTPPSGVPEPGTFVLLGAGLVGVGALRYRR
jgi:hypothetical protein